LERELVGPVDFEATHDPHREAGQLTEHDRLVGMMLR
jgi:hypothetical protein